MHFLPDDGEKLTFLKELRRRLVPGAPLILADVSVDESAFLKADTPAFYEHAILAGVPLELAEAAAAAIVDLPVVSASRTSELMQQAGFAAPRPIFRGLWYAGWQTTAVA